MTTPHKRINSIEPAYPEGWSTGEPPPPATESADLLDYPLLREQLGFVLGSASRHRLLALASFLAVAGMGVGSLWVVPKRYQVQAIILAQRNAVMSTLSNPGLPRSYEWDAPTRAARETVLRRDNLVSLCKETAFVDKYLERRPSLVRFRDWIEERISGKQRSREELLDDLVDMLETRLYVEVRDGSVAITFQWWDKEIAFQLVSAALESFLEVRHVSELAVMSDAISILQGHANKVHAELEPTMQALDDK